MYQSSNEPSIAVVTPIFNRIGNLKRFFDALCNVTYGNYKVIVVDDGSTDGSAEYILGNHPDVVLLRGDGGLWWAGSTNKGIEWALEHNFDYVLTYNDDQICDPNFLAELVSAAKDFPQAILSSHIYYLDEPKRLVSGGIRIDPKTRQTYGVHNEETIETVMLPYEVDCVPGYAVLIPMEVIRTAGLFNNKRFPQIYMELEFCLRAQQHGFRIVVVPSSFVWNDRDDKNEDPIKTRNIFKRFSWYTRSYKSNFNLKQTYHLAAILYLNNSGRNYLSLFFYWMRYFTKLIISSLMSKNSRRIIKGNKLFNKDKWA